ncbi:hypothetical protein G5T42_03150 [Microbacterium sp. 4R-513]|uniref:hypothetical protein n=1 Tax=Microbacterium sp. 4R-513 TaxID=2567934 RepID=UPI0013E1BB32|nr:hypothetical protein [Microbacterium sp. 4R-513]QIG38608.1 hypothetical protein G5T42_03150 [Microbacterium sp. 4R-513]
MTADRPPEHGHVRPLVALGLVTAAFGALVICALGVTSLLLDEDVIAVPGLGQIPGVLGTVSAIGAFALAVWLTIRRAHPSYWGAAIAAVAAVMAYPLGVWFGALLGGADLAAAAGAAGGVLTSWVGVVIAASAFACAWAGVALVRTNARRPRWPWEDPDDE